MTDEAKALVDRLRAIWANSHNTLWNPDGPAAVDLIETQAREIERLREVLEEFVASTGVSDDPDILLVEASVYEHATRVLGERR